MSILPNTRNTLVCSLTKYNVFRRFHCGKAVTWVLLLLKLKWIRFAFGNAIIFLLSTEGSEYGVPFVDVGMGLEKANSSLVGIVRTSYCDPAQNDNIPDSIPRVVNEDGDDLYTSNIQTNELNALNAVMAVIKWKKHCDFYVDLEGEGSSIYTLDGNHMLNKGGGE